MDLPAQSFVLAENPGSPVSLALLSMDKYGFRCREDSMALTLIRGSYEPDLTPETGRHRISFALTPVPAASADGLPGESLAYNHPFTVISGKSGKGAGKPPAASPDRAGGLEVRHSLLRLRDDSAAGIVLSAVKRPEAGGNRLLLRVYESAGRDGAAVFQLGFTAKAAYFTGATEKERLGECTLGDGGRTLSFPVPACSVRAVIVEGV
jgi:alpha-mannosidase